MGGKMFENNKKAILIVLTLILLIITGVNVKNSDKGILFDEQVMEYVHNRTNPLGIFIMKKITYLGSIYFLVPLAIIIFLVMAIKKNTSGIVLLITSLAGSSGLNSIIKAIFTRTRPLEYFLIEQGGYSFPSGHSMVSMTFYTTVSYLIIKNLGKVKIKSILIVMNFIIVGAIGFSRIYLGVHWPTDVIVGYLFGYTFYYTLVDLYSKKLLS